MSGIISKNGALSNRTHLPWVWGKLYVVIHCVGKVISINLGVEFYINLHQRQDYITILENMKYQKIYLIWLRSKYCHLLFTSLFILKEEQISTTLLAAQKANCNIYWSISE